MADKDFRENAPLDAARDAQAHLEARIRQIEDQLRHAVIIDADAKAGRANLTDCPTHAKWRASRKDCSRSAFRRSARRHARQD